MRASARRRGLSGIPKSPKKREKKGLAREEGEDGDASRGRRQEGSEVTRGEKGVSRLIRLLGGETPDAKVHANGFFGFLESDGRGKGEEEGEREERKGQRGRGKGDGRGRTTSWKILTESNGSQWMGDMKDLAKTDRGSGVSVVGTRPEQSRRETAD